GVVFSADGKAVYAASTSGLVKGWDLATGRRLFESQVSRQGWGLARAPDGRLLATTERDRLTFLSPVRKVVGHSQGLGGSLLSVESSPDGNSVAAAGRTDENRAPVAVADLRLTEAGEVPYVASVETTNVRHGPTNYTDPGAVYQVAYSLDGKLLAAAC